MIAVNSLDASAQLQDAKPLLFAEISPTPPPQTSTNRPKPVERNQHLNMKAPGRPELFCKTNSNLFGRVLCWSVQARERSFWPVFGLKGKGDADLVLGKHYAGAFLACYLFDR